MLADWTAAFTRLGHEMDKRVPDWADGETTTFEVADWDGWSQEMCDKVWDKVHQDQNGFWSTLQPLEHTKEVTELLMHIGERANLQVLTSRHSPKANERQRPMQWITQRWLDKHYRDIWDVDELAYHPAYRLERGKPQSWSLMTCAGSEPKAEIMKAIGANYILDDSPRVVGHLLAIRFRGHIGIKRYRYNDVSAVYDWHCRSCSRLNRQPMRMSEMEGKMRYYDSLHEFLTFVERDIG